jgi:DNA mismatch repair protein MutS2
MTLTLLDLVPVVRVDEAALRQTLVFAFATGDVGDALAQVVDQMAVISSSWDPKDFASEVFLDVLLERAFPLHIEGKAFPKSIVLLRRILCSPPTDPSVTAFRQEILGELVQQSEVRSAVERLYLQLFHLRGLLTRTSATRVDPFERRLAVLRALRDVVVIAADDLRGARSGLSRVGTWGAEVKATPGYAHLVELLAYEEGSAEIDVRLRLGFDGKIRELVLLERRELAENSFHMGSRGRLAARLGFFVRGYDFSLHELFARLCDEVFEGLVDSFLAVFPLMGDLEFYLASLGFRDLALARGLEVTLASFAERTGYGLESLFNPFLALDSAPVVACDLRTRASDARVVVTGPNSGGKTRLLQSIALTQILGQAGSFVPARRAELPWVSGLFVSLIEHAKADQREGRLGTELLRIRRLFETLRVGSLVILDELCSGTNPTEGEEIFRLVVNLLGELCPLAFITTHFLAFAHRLATEPGSLEFLQVELAGEEPTYRFIPGVATTSLAHKTAERLGVTEEKLRALVAKNNPEREKPEPVEARTELCPKSPSSIPTSKPPPTKESEREGAPSGLREGSGRSRMLA